MEWQKILKLKGNQKSIDMNDDDKITEEDLRLFFFLLALDLETLRRFKFVLFANPPFA